MPWKHIENPTLGMITNENPTRIASNASPFVKGIYIRDGEICSDFGMTNFPVPGALKTNALLGTVMKVETFHLFSGVSYLLAMTTRHLYQYNTSTSTWDVVTIGTLLDNCESAFTASANVTSTADTSVKLRGSKSSKNVIASAFTTGIVSYRNNGGAIDVSAAANTHISFWAYCNTTVASDVFRLRLSEQNAGGTGATYADFTIPALTANTWQHVSIAMTSAVAGGGVYPTDLNAVLSVALVAQSDPGAVTIYIDDVRTAKEFTGDEDNRFSFTTQRDVGIITNGVDAPSQVSDSSGVVHAVLTLTLPTGSLTTSEVVIAFKDHVLYMNNTENSADVPQRVSWTNIGSVSDLVNGTAGFQDLTDDDSWIVGSALLSENEIAIYKERSIIQCVWVGGHTPFRFTTIVNDTGAINKDCIAKVSGYHIVASIYFLYVYNGSSTIKTFDDPINKTLYNRIDGTYEDRAFLIIVKEDNEVQFWIPTASTTPDEGWTFYLQEKNWYIKDRNISGSGSYQRQTSLTIGDLVGTIGEQSYTFGSTLLKTFSPITLVGDVNGKVYFLDKSSFNNNATAITSEFQTPDFVVPKAPLYDSASSGSATRLFIGENNFMRISGLIYEASGQTVTTEWSSDGGLTWNPTQGSAQNVVTLTSLYDFYQQDFEANVKKIRFRFRKIAASKGFKLRYYGFHWAPRTGRR